MSQKSHLKQKQYVKGLLSLAVLTEIKDDIEKIKKIRLNVAELEDGFLLPITANLPQNFLYKAMR